jgi:hypothetical protein
MTKHPERGKLHALPLRSAYEEVRPAIAVGPSVSETEPIPALGITLALSAGLVVGLVTAVLRRPRAPS